MKRVVLTMAVLLGCMPLVTAVPAERGLSRYVQPDGSVILIEQHGDEFYHWTTDANGNVVEQDADGFYRPATLDRAKMRQARTLRDEANRHRVSSRASSKLPAQMTVPVLLIGFSDLPFQKTKEEFEALLNENGYSDNGATGSVRDYFYENSNGKFEPHFVVYDPVQLDKGYAYYGDAKGPKYAAQALSEACTKLDGLIDFSQYDSDGDKEVDMIFFYFAGHNAAEGAGEDRIWPHHGYLLPAEPGARTEFDGVRVGWYSCTSELKDWPVSSLCGIGITCHEFAHSLGLPDFYDTDYEKSGGENETLGEYSLMSDGNYNNGSRTPPYLNAVERNMLGWMDEPQVITASGDYRLTSIKNNAAYKMNTAVDGEYFLYECRDGSGWDAPLNPGLVVYHVDQSGNPVTEGGPAASDLWSRGYMINAYYGHPCFYIVPSSNGGLVYPGKYGDTDYTPVSWDGNSLGVRLSSIAYASGTASFHVDFPETGHSVSGYVRNTLNQPVQGAEIRLYKARMAFAAASSTPRITPISEDRRAVTDAEGYYSISLTEEEAAGLGYVLNVTAAGYVTASENIATERNYVVCDIALKTIEEGEMFDLYKYDASKAAERVFDGSSVKLILESVKFTAAELEEKGCVGKTLHSVQFKINAKSVDQAYVVVYYGSEMKCKHLVENLESDRNMTVDISSAGLVVPENQDIYIGYALENASSLYAYVRGPLDRKDSQGGYFAYSYNSPNWQNIVTLNGYYDLDLSVKTVRSSPVTLSVYGINSIATKEAYHAGESFELKLAGTAARKPAAVVWHYDGNPVEASSVTLEKGSHVVKAKLTFHDGTSEALILEFEVQ